MQEIGKIFTVRKYGDGPSDWQLLPHATAETIDAIFDAEADNGEREYDINAMLNALADGELSAAQIAKIQAAMKKYAGASSGNTSRVGITASDAQAIDAGRAERVHSETVARGYKIFWERDAAKRRQAELDLANMR